MVLGFRALGVLGFRVWGFTALGVLGFRALGVFGFRVWGFRVWGLGPWFFSTCGFALGLAPYLQSLSAWDCKHNARLSIRHECRASCTSRKVLAHAYL